MFRVRLPGAFCTAEQWLAKVDALKALTLIPAAAKTSIDLFLQTSEDPLDVSAPEAAGYELQSHGIIETLEKLMDKFTDQRTVLEKTELHSKPAFDMSTQV